MASPVAYDLDGVIIGEIDSKNYPYLLPLRGELLPLFQPRAPYFVITGRPVCDRDSTLEWMFRYLRERPRIIQFRASLNHCVLEHKAGELRHLHKHHGVTTYVESDAAQVVYLRENTPVRVLHFADLIQASLNQEVHISDVQAGIDRWRAECAKLA